MEVKLIGTLVPMDTKLATTDVVGIPGVSAPEHFSTGVVKSANLQTDNFLLASVLFLTLVGYRPYAVTEDSRYAYVRMNFNESNETIMEKFGHVVQQNWIDLGNDLQRMFKRNFGEGVTSVDARYEPDDWAMVFQQYM